METVEAIKVCERKVWIEQDVTGSKHVMVQHDSPNFEPFCYCTFNYDYGYTDNSAIRERAESVAKSLGASDPVEYRHRDI